MTTPVPLNRAQEQLATHKRPSRPNSSFLRSNYRFSEKIPVCLALNVSNSPSVPV